MILQALTAYYEELASKGKLPSPGWDPAFKVSFALEVGDDGALLDVVDLREPASTGKKKTLMPKFMPVPAHPTRSSGVLANFLCDNSAYLLGAVEDEKKAGRAKQCFAACAEFHHKLLNGVDCPAARAVLAFFDRWDPDTASVHPLLKEKWQDIIGNSNLVFYYDYPDGRHSVTEDPAFRDAWNREYHAETDSVKTQCLVTGRYAAVAPTHPQIKGVAGAQSSGAALVSFNAPSFCSYNHVQGENAPVSEYGAFAYTTALNTLLADRNHCQRVGDTTVVCWAENAGEAYADLGIDAVFGVPEESGIQESDVTTALKLLSEGKNAEWNGVTLLPDQHFYFLGLSPNAARLSVRFFIRDTFGGFARHIREHRQALEIAKPAYEKRESLSVWQLARETVNLKERTPAPAPQLAGDILRAVLTGGMYPATLLNGVTLRIRAERDITYGRAAIIKAYYLRRKGLIPEEVLTVYLNEESDYQPYVLGRLFAVLEAVQNAANPEINTTIRERYFSSACATPAIVFPTLIKLSQKHLQKLGDKQKIYYDRQITELLNKMNTAFPARLTLTEQGAFELGYYHQKQKRFEKKDREEE